MKKLSPIGIYGGLREIHYKIEKTKNKLLGKLFGCFALALPVGILGLFLPNFIVQIISSAGIVVGLIALGLYIDFVITKKHIAKPPTAYDKYCLLLYQLVTFVNQQIHSYNVMYKQKKYMAGNNGLDPIEDDNLEQIYQTLLKKSTRIWAMIDAMDETQKLLDNQENYRLIHELSHSYLSEVEQADSLLLNPANCESLQTEVEREQEALASFHELNR